MLLYETAHNYTSGNIYIDSGEADDHIRMNGGINHAFAQQGQLTLAFENLFNDSTEWALSSWVLFSASAHSTTASSSKRLSVYKLCLAVSQ